MIDKKLRDTLLDSMENGSLLFLCGAGLSMPPPSNLPNAKDIAIECYQNCLPLDPSLDPNSRDNLSAIATHFHNSGRFYSVFLKKVPWERFSGRSNEGHSALADFLLCKAILAVLSTNFDTMIERWINQHRNVDFQAKLDGHEADNITENYSPLYKIHGCMERDRQNTIWTDCQLSENVIKGRLESLKRWMNLKLPNRNLVIIGFWTEWQYLNSIIEESLKCAGLNSVIVIDPRSSHELENGASDLWRILNKDCGNFEHHQISGDFFLKELRTEFSKKWLREFYALSNFGDEIDDEVTNELLDSIDQEKCFLLRKDLEGVDYDCVCHDKSPNKNTAISASRVHKDLIANGAIFDGLFFKINEKRVRVVNAQRRNINDIVREFHSNPTQKFDIIILAGAEGVLRTDLVGNRSKVEWYKTQSAYERLGIK